MHLGFHQTETLAVPLHSLCSLFLLMPDSLSGSMFFPFPLLSTFQILCFLQDPAQGPPTPCCFPSLPPPLPLPSRGNEIAPFSRTVKTLYYQKLCGHVLSLLRDINSSGENFSLCPLRPSLAISRHLVNLLNENTFAGCCLRE